MLQRYTRREVGRILGLDVSRLRYWERLQLVRPQSRWGERFYSFGDLVALRSIQRLTQKRIPARRLRRAITLVEKEFDTAPIPIQEIRLLENGRDVLVIPPGASKPFNPIRQQWVFSFEPAAGTTKLRLMSSPTAEELFESALSCESQKNALPLAADTYRRVLTLAPDWVDAHINLGVALYQMGRIREAEAEFRAAVDLDSRNGISRYNLGCVLEEQGETDEAIEHLLSASRTMPSYADAHFNLALAYENRREFSLAREQWMLYLRYAPNGPWAEQARARLKAEIVPRKMPAPIPFPRRKA